MRRDLFWLIVQANNPSWQTSQGRKSWKQLSFPPSPIRKQRPFNACCCSAPFLHVYSPDPAREWCHLHWIGLLTSSNAIKIIAQQHAQRPIFQVILDSVMLTVNTSKDTYLNLNYSYTVNIVLCLCVPCKCFTTLKKSI